MTDLLQSLMNGLALAAVYALLALGFVIIYKSMQVLSFAQPALMLFGGWFVVYFSSRLGLNFYLAVLLAVLVAGATGFLIERSFLRPMVGKPVFAVAIMTIGIDLVVRIITGNLFGTQSGSTSDPWGLNLFFGPAVPEGGLGIAPTLTLPDVTLDKWLLALLVLVVIGVVLGIAYLVMSRRIRMRRESGFEVRASAWAAIGVPWLSVAGTGAVLTVLFLLIGPGKVTFALSEIVLNQRRVAAIVVATVVITALLLLFRYSRVGLAMRATAFDQEVALTQGVSVPSVFALSWAIAAILATLGALFISPNTGTIEPNQFAFALKALPVVVVGGLDSIGGALIAAIIIGVAEALTITYQPEYAAFLGGSFAHVMPYLVMFVVLLIRPYGLFGTREVERV
jgi:branched-chain amino acid transport system permease protein